MAQIISLFSVNSFHLSLITHSLPMEIIFLYKTIYLREDDWFENQMFYVVSDKN